MLSGLLVTIISRVAFSRRDRREYNQKLQSANREIIYALRSGISEGHIADRHIVECLIKSTARKYSVADTDLHDPAQIVEELVKEIMDSSFISAKTKNDYCSQLGFLMAPIELGSEPARARGNRLDSELREYRSRTVRMVSAILGIVTAVMTIVVVFNEDFTSDADPLTPVFALASMTVAMIVAVAGFAIAQRTRRRIDRRATRDKHGVDVWGRIEPQSHDDSGDS